MSEKKVDAQPSSNVPLKEEDQSSNSIPQSETRTKKRRRVSLGIVAKIILECRRSLSTLSQAAI